MVSTRMPTRINRLELGSVSTVKETNMVSRGLASSLLVSTGLFLEAEAVDQTTFHVLVFTELLLVVVQPVVTVSLVYMPGILLLPLSVLHL